MSWNAIAAGYLQAFGFWIAISFGSLGLTLIHRLTGGRWGEVMGPLLTSAMTRLPVLALLFVPIALAIPDLYPWARPEFVAGSSVVAAKVAYLNQSFFLIRAAVYLVSWSAISFVLSRPGGLGQHKGFVGVSLLWVALSGSFAAFDWFMSLEPEWFSSLYGALFLTGSLLSTFAFLSVMTVWLRREISPGDWHDIGKLTLMSVMLWAYLNFSQYLIIWMANIPEEMSWYHHRSHGGWRVLGTVLVICHFFVPFLLLLSRELKRRARAMGYLAAGLLVMRFLDFMWWVEPSVSPDHFRLPIWSVLSFVVLGAIWMFGFLRRHA